MSQNFNSVCPHCKLAMDATTGMTGRERPSAGDYTMCLYCGEVSVFDKDLIAQVPTTDEYIEIGGNKMMSALRQAWMDARASVDNMDPDKEVNSLDTMFGVVEKGLMSLDLPPTAIPMLKTIFTVGAKSVFNMMDQSKYPPHIAAKMLINYQRSVEQYLRERDAAVPKEFRTWL